MYACFHDENPVACKPVLGRGEGVGRVRMQPR